MRQLLITKRAKLSYSHYDLVFVMEDGTSGEIPISDLEIVVVATTKATITSHLLQALSSNGIPVVFEDTKHLPSNLLLPIYGNNKQHERTRTQLLASQTAKDRLWQHIVRLKLESQQAVLMRHTGTGSDRFDDLIANVEIGDATNREAVGARLYFNHVFGDEFTRHAEAGNIINQMLDYGYSLLLSVTATSIVKQGFSTLFGIHHDNKQNQFNLASDLMEVFRVFVDEKVLTLLPEVGEMNWQTKVDLLAVLRDPVKMSGAMRELQQAIDDFVWQSMQYLIGNAISVPAGPQYEV